MRKKWYIFQNVCKSLITIVTPIPSFSQSRLRSGHLIDLLTAHFGIQPWSVGYEEETHKKSYESNIYSNKETGAKTKEKQLKITETQEKKNKHTQTK